MRHARGLQALHQQLICSTPRRVDQPPYVVYLHGPSGRGKTKFAWDLGTALTGAHFPDGTGVYFKPSNKWFDFYSAQPLCVLDDLRSENYNFDWLLRFLDRYPMVVECKGSSVQFSSPLIIVTSIKSPHELCPQDEPFAQLSRRLSRVIDVSTANLEEDIQIVEEEVRVHFRKYKIVIAPLLDE